MHPHCSLTLKMMTPLHLLSLSFLQSLHLPIAALHLCELSQHSDHQFLFQAYWCFWALSNWHSHDGSGIFLIFVNHRNPIALQYLDYISQDIKCNICDKNEVWLSITFKKNKGVISEFRHPCHRISCKVLEKSILKWPWLSGCITN